MKLSKLLLNFVLLVCSTAVLAKININTSTVAELETLEGIGVKKAAKIIEYREKVGHFKSIEDLIHVSGIGTVTLDKIRDEIEVEENNNHSNSEHDSKIKEAASVVKDKEGVNESSKKVKSSKDGDTPSEKEKQQKNKDSSSSS